MNSVTTWGFATAAETSRRGTPRRMHGDASGDAYPVENKPEKFPIDAAIEAPAIAVGAAVTLRLAERPAPEEGVVIEVVPAGAPAPCDVYVVQCRDGRFAATAAQLRVVAP